MRVALKDQPLVELSPPDGVVERRVDEKWQICQLRWNQRMVLGRYA